MRNGLEPAKKTTSTECPVLGTTPSKRKSSPLGFRTEQGYSLQGSTANAFLVSVLLLLLPIGTAPGKVFER